MNEKIAQYRAESLNFGIKWVKDKNCGLVRQSRFYCYQSFCLHIVFSRTDYELAFRDLDSTDAAAIMEYLDIK